MPPRNAPAAQVRVEFSEQAGLPYRFDRALVRKLVQSIIRAEASAGHFALSVHLIDDENMQTINRTQRGVDATTDVLSFPLHDPVGLRFVLPPDEPVHLGDVMVSFTRAESQAREYGHSLEREVLYLITHGVLHLLGYDHEQEGERRAMRTREEAALGALGITR